MNTYNQSDFSENEKFVSFFDELPFWSAPFGLLLLDSVPPAKHKKVLDIGCGTGFPILELAQRFGKTSAIYGVDPWKTAIKRLKSKIDYFQYDNVFLIDAVAESLPFEDAGFDYVVSNNGLNNVQSFEKSLSEINRVLKMNSELIFTYNLPETFSTFYDTLKDVLKLFGHLDEIIKTDNHIFVKRKPKDYTFKKLSEHGFEIISTKESSFDYKFADAESFFNHAFIKSAFFKSWLELVPSAEKNKIFENIRIELNRQSNANSFISLDVPFICIKAKKIKERDA